MFAISVYGSIYFYCVDACGLLLFLFLFLFLISFFSYSVIEKPIRVQTENEQIRLGSNAVMRCVIPRDYQEYVHVSAWMTDNGHILLLPFIDSNDFIQGNY